MTGGDGSGAPSDGREARRQRRPGATEADGRAAPAPAPAPEAERPGHRPRRSRPLRILLLALLTGAALGAAWLYREFSPVSDSPELVEVEILPGWGANRVARELEGQGVIRNARVFSAFLRLRDFDRSLGEGLFDLDRSATVPELARELVRGGRPRVARVVIPEGMRGQELAERMAAAGLGTTEEYLELIANPGELAPEHTPDGATLEGYLFPASYEFPLDGTPEEALARMLRRFEAELDDEVAAALSEMELSTYDWVTLASLVQAEAGSDQEMPLIAGVFLNRLDLGMPLQSDPTVAYGLGKRLPELDALAGDLRRDHPWNTYTRGGLPQGPITNPGRAALRAVLDPIRHDEQGREFLYFLHGHDGEETVFRLNTGLEGHNDDVARYLRGE